MDNTTSAYHAEFASGCRATITLSAAGMSCVWIPDVPRLEGRKLRQFLASYRQWRNESIADFAQRTGLRIAVVDV